MEDALGKQGASATRLPAASDAAAGFGPRLRQARERAGLGIRGLARAAGTGHGVISRIENGHENPSLEMAERLAAALGLSRDDVCRPHRCGCRANCEELTYSKYKKGHAPIARAGQPVLERRDRPDRSPDDEGLSVDERVGARMCQKRLELGLTQGALGRLVHATWTTISNIETGRSMPSEPLARLLAAQLGVDAVAFFELAPCPCDRENCETLTVGGRYARGCSPLPGETRARLAHEAEKRYRLPEWRAWRDWLSAKVAYEWHVEPGPLIRGLMQAAREGQTVIPIHGSTRQEIAGVHGRKGSAAGIEAGRACGGRKPLATSEQQQRMLELHRGGWRLRPIAAEVFGHSRYKDRVARFLQR